MAGTQSNLSKAKPRIQLLRPGPEGMRTRADAKPPLHDRKKCTTAPAAASALFNRGAARPVVDSGL